MRNANFDHVAVLYPLLEQLVFGSALSRSRSVFMQEVIEGKNLLLIGEGNGRFLSDIVKQNSASAITVVDSSSQMLSAAAKRIAAIDGCAKVRFLNADFLDWQSPFAHYDRIVTHYFLDLYRPDRIRRIVEQISCLATEDSRWINVDFTKANPRMRQTFLMWAQYRFFRTCAGIEAERLFDPLSYIEQAGWRIIESKSLEQGWIAAQLLSRQPVN